MANLWTGVITNAGSTLAHRWLSGESLEITGVTGGTGKVPEVALLAQTALVNRQQTLGIAQSILTDAGLELKARIGAADVAYNLQQIGIWARIGQETPVLLALFQRTDAGLSIPAKSEMPDFAVTFVGVIACSGKANFSATIDTTVVATRGDVRVVEERLAAHAADKNNPHGVTKMQVGLGKVDNTADKDKPISTAQQAALDAHAGNTTLHITDAERRKWNAKQDALTFDTAPTADSLNPVTSGGVRADIDKKSTEITTFVTQTVASLTIISTVQPAAAAQKFGGIWMQPME